MLYLRMCIYLSTEFCGDVIEHSVEHYCTMYLMLKFAISFCNDRFVSERTRCTGVL